MRPGYVLGWVSALALAACGDGTSVAATADTLEQPIIGGSLETGAPEVGALTIFQPSVGYWGAACTATLIAPAWALTAAQCVVGAYVDGRAPLAEELYFYVGNDAQTGPGFAKPSSGVLYRVRAVYPHAAYDPSTSTSDVALLRLAAPIPDVTPATLSSTALQGATGATLSVIGFGSATSTSANDGGIKRRGSFLIDYYDATFIASLASASACVAGADIGGPAFLDVAGAPEIVGLTLGTTNECTDYVIFANLPPFAPWASSTIADAPTDCNVDASLCDCSAACQLDGSCLASACEDFDCTDVHLCLADCAGDASCEVACYRRGDGAARAAYDALIVCRNLQCLGLADAALDACLAANCTTAVAGCFGPATSVEGESCRVAFSCATGLVCAGDGPDTLHCLAPCDLGSPSCPSAGQQCESVALPTATTVCSPVGGTACACDLTPNGCDASCPCDPACPGACLCDVTADTCDAGCDCDASCPPPCTCDLTADVCDTGCDCDASCPPPCTCDLTADVCDTGCDCDASCTTEPGTEPDPTPDPKPHKSSGCSAQGTGGDASWLAAVALVVVATRRRRPSHKTSPRWPTANPARSSLARRGGRATRAKTERCESTCRVD